MSRHIPHIRVDRLVAVLALAFSLSLLAPPRAEAGDGETDECSTAVNPVPGVCCYCHLEELPNDFLVTGCKKSSLANAVFGNCKNGDREIGYCAGSCTPSGGGD